VPNILEDFYLINGFFQQQESKATYRTMNCLHHKTKHNILLQIKAECMGFSSHVYGIYICWRVTQIWWRMAWYTV